MADIRANRVSDDLMEEIAVECAKRGRLSMREATIQAFQQWLSKAPAVPAPKTDQNNSQKAHPYPKHIEIHNMLEFILSNDQKAADWIIGNLHMFEEALKSRRAEDRPDFKHHRRKAS